jgi:hypothetical protein
VNKNDVSIFSGNETTYAVDLLYLSTGPDPDSQLEEPRAADFDTVDEPDLAYDLKPDLETIPFDLTEDSINSTETSISASPRGKLVLARLVLVVVGSGPGLSTVTRYLTSAPAPSLASSSYDTAAFLSTVN